MEFYYLWKKTPGANNNRPHRRRRAGSLRRNRVTRASNAPTNKKEETPEPSTDTRPASITKEDNSSLTEDDASECESDSSATNKRKIIRGGLGFFDAIFLSFVIPSGSTSNTTEVLGDESPSRMRTRNKQAKDQSSNKRPKRGTDTPDTANDNPKTPNKNDKRKSTNSKPETPKAKKRPNIDVDADNDTSEDKDKRKRSDVSIPILFSPYGIETHFDFQFAQSPTESMNSDSRPESVIDDQENTSEPPESSLSVNVPKDAEEKLEDPLSIAITEPLSCVSSNEKDEEVEEESNQDTSVIDPSSSEQVEPEPAADETVELKVDIKLPNEEEEEERNSATTENLPLTVPAQPDQPIAFVTQPISQPPPAPVPSVPVPNSPTPFAAKDEEMIAASNIKQEAAPVSAAAVNYASKDVLYIKKEPGDDSTDNSNSNEPHDLKVKVEIKTEKKPETSEQDQKFEDDQAAVPKPPSFEGHIKYGMPDPHMKYAMDASKYGDPMKFSHENLAKYPTDMSAAMKYPSPEGLKYNPDAVMKYDMKPYMENPPKYADDPMKPYPESPMKMEQQPQMLKGGPYQTEPADMKYNPDQGPHKYPMPPEAMKYENDDSPIGLNKHPYPDPHSAHRNPYDQPQPMLKFGDPMAKFHGMPPTASNPQDLKYITSPDMKYRVQDGPIKSQYSADNLIKSSPYPDHLSAMKYPPTDSHIDNSARSTPNQDSQGSNSNFQTQLHPHGNIPSPQTRVPSPQNPSPHLSQSQPTPLILSHPGLPGHHSSSHLPSNHPSLLSSSASPNVVPGGLTQPPPHLHGNSNIPPGLPSGLNPSNVPLIPPPTSTSAAHPTLHRPHQDIPSPLHHPLGAFSSGIPPSHAASSHNQSPSAAINNSRNESERIERRDGGGGLHHRASPVGGMIPGNSSGLLAHPSMPHMHLGGPPNVPPSVALPLLSSHHPSHLGPPLLPPTNPVPNAPLPLISSHSGSGLSDGRHTPISVPPSSTHTPTPTTASSAFSRTSPSVQYSLPPSSAHRTSSPSQPPSSLTRGSPLHLPPHHSSASALSAGKNEFRTKNPLPKRF